MSNSISNVTNKYLKKIPKSFGGFGIFVYFCSQLQLSLTLLKTTYENFKYDVYDRYVRCVNPQ